jgi:hypothetical protein
MDLIDNIMKLWPVFLAFITLVVILAKADNRIAVLEEKVRTLFELINKERK